MGETPAPFARSRGIVQHVKAHRYSLHGTKRSFIDPVITEEPLEIRLAVGTDDPRSIAVTMRTPGDDFHLAAGFLYTEGIVQCRDEIRRIRYCLNADIPSDQRYNVVTVDVQDDLNVDGALLQRNFWATSSCGLCGKERIGQILVRGVRVARDRWQVSTKQLLRMPETMLPAQKQFSKTGGVHACGLFDAEGRLLDLKEDIGRHNALDKLIGKRLLEGCLPDHATVLQISGRASFEMVQKAAVAGIPVVSSISAPSSLAIEAAEAFGITLVGFLRDENFNVYTHPDRVVADG